jgi:hypothetical protein
MRRRVALALVGASVVVAACDNARPTVLPNPLPKLVEVMRAGGTITLPEGTWYLKNDYAAPGTTIRGAGRGKTFLVLQDPLANLIRYDGPITLSDLTLLGANANGIPYATGMALTGRGDALLERVTLDDFCASYWVNANDGDVYARFCQVITREGNLCGPQGEGLTQYVSTIFSLYGSGRLTVEDSDGELTHAKQMVSVWSGCNGVVRRTTARNVGMSPLVGWDAGAYAFLAYNEPVSGPVWPTLVVEDSEVLGARSCGIYSASAGLVVSRRNYYERIPDKLDSTIPKGAIAINGTTNFISEDDEFGPGLFAKYNIATDRTRNVIR